VAKRKPAPPFRQADFDGFLERGWIGKSGAWLSFEGERIGQEREDARKLLPDAVYAAQGSKRPVPVKPEAAGATAAVWSLLWPGRETPHARPDDPLEGVSHRRDRN